MRKLVLKNAQLESLTINKVVFIGELKGYIKRLSYSIIKERYFDLLQLNKNQKYNIWKTDNILKFIAK